MPIRGAAVVNSSGETTMAKRALILESGRALGVARIGARPDVPIAWHGPDEILLDGHLMTRQAGGR